MILVAPHAVGCVTASAVGPRFTGTVQALAHRQAQGLNASPAKVGHDGGVAAAQQGPQGAAELGGEHFAHVGAVADGFDAADHGVPHDVGPQRVALTFTTGFGQHRADIGVKFAQLPLAGVGDLQPEAFCGNLGFDLAVFHQAECIPVGGRRFVRGLERAMGGQTGLGRGAQLTNHALVKSVVEGQDEDGRLAVQFKLRPQQPIALKGMGGGQSGQAQALDGALDGLTGGQLEPLDGRFQGGGQAMNGVRFHVGADAPRGSRLVCGKPMQPVVNRALPRARDKREKTVTS